MSNGERKKGGGVEHRKVAERGLREKLTITTPPY